jgi:hypothetical protein
MSTLSLLCDVRDVHRSFYNFNLRNVSENWSLHDVPVCPHPPYSVMSEMINVHESHDDFYFNYVRVYSEGCDLSDVHTFRDLWCQRCLKPWGLDVHDLDQASLQLKQQVRYFKVQYKSLLTVTSVCFSGSGKSSGPCQYRKKLPLGTYSHLNKYKTKR